MKHIKDILLLAAVGVGIASCTDDDLAVAVQEQPQPGMVKAELTIAVPSKGSSRASTRQSDAIVQKEDGSFRGMQDIFLFGTRVNDQTNDSIEEDNIMASTLLTRIVLPSVLASQMNEIGAGGLDNYPDAKLRGHVYTEVAVPTGVNAFLFYGKAYESAATSDVHSVWSTNGHIWKNIASDNDENTMVGEGIPYNDSWRQGDLNKIRFRPYSIFRHETNVEVAQGYKAGHALAAYLSDVANALLGYRYGIGEEDITPRDYYVDIEGDDNDLTEANVPVYRYNMADGTDGQVSDGDNLLVRHTSLDDKFKSLTAVDPNNPLQVIQHWVGGEKVNRAGMITGSSANVFEAVQDLYTVVRFFDSPAGHEVLKVIAKGLDEQYVDANGLPIANQLSGRLPFTVADGAEEGHTAVYRGDRIYVNYNNTIWGTELAGQPINGTSMINYPADIELPDGAARMMYSKANHRFEMKMTDVVGETNAEKGFYRAFGITAVDAFAYPLPLYYRGVSKIKTSDAEENEHYEAGTDWSDILKQYTAEADDGVAKDTIVTATTQSIIINDPVQYAVARVDVNVRAADIELLDGENDEDRKVYVGQNRFPITSVLIGGQRVVGWDFNPVLEGEDLVTSDSRVEAFDYVVYDRHVNDDIYLQHLTGDDYVPVTSTLVLPSAAKYTKEDMTPQKVRVAVEFENQSGNSFTGVNGQIIANNCKFYLIGELPLNQLSEGGRFFQQDHVTTLKLNVASLANAYNTIPNLRAPLLELGLTVEKWIMATPANVKL